MTTTREHSSFATAEEIAALHGDPVWEAIWSVVKTWDINTPRYTGYCSGTGDHATEIFRAIRAASQAGGVPAGWREALELSLEAVALALEIAVRRGVTADWLPTQALFLKTHERIVNALSASPPPPATDGDALREALEDCAEYFDQRADADQPTGCSSPIPNEEMSLLIKVRNALASVPTPVIRDFQITDVSGTDAVEVEREALDFIDCKCTGIECDDEFGRTTLRLHDFTLPKQVNSTYRIALVCGTDGGTNG